MSINIITNVSHYKLLENLISNIKLNSTNPFKKQTIVIQSNGMARWLSLNIADKFNITANINFLFPYKLLSEVYKLLDNNELVHYYNETKLSIIIYSIIKDTNFFNEFEIVNNYIKSISNNDGSLFNFANELAKQYEKYFQYRPEWIYEWNNNKIIENLNDPYKHQIWQQKLWLKIKEIIQKPDLIETLNFISQKLNTIIIDEKNQLNNIHFFGISHLSPFYLLLLENLINSNIQVYYYFQTPSIEYYADQNKTTSLLGSFARLGKDYFDLMNQKFDLFFDETSLNFIEEIKEKNTLLAHLQYDVLKCIERKVDNFQHNDLFNNIPEIKDDDKSIEILSTHTPMREIEVVYDKILEILSNDKHSKPDDILVMAPNINNYSDYIEAVFQNKLPFNISDRNLLSENILFNSFFKIISIYFSRFSVNEILNLLQMDIIRKKFDLNDIDLAYITRWLNDTNVNWGIDDKFKENLGLPNTIENTWEQAFDRMFLGFSIGTEFSNNQTSLVFSVQNKKNIYNSKFIFPYDEIEGEAVNVLSKFYTFFVELKNVYSLLQKSYKIDEWNTIIKNIILSFYPEENQDKILTYFQSIFNDIKLIDNSEFISNFKINFPAFFNFLKTFFDNNISTNKFLQNGITFCSILPMRTIPFKYIFLIGMNIDSFPKETNIPNFDLTKNNYKKGDKTQSDDDKFIFLETLLATREKLIISYTGKDEYTNEVKQISTVIDELLNYINTYYKLPDGINDIRKILTTEHFMQGYFKEYFLKDSDFFTYNKKYYEIAKIIYSESENTTQNNFDIKTDQLPNFNSISLEELSWFFLNPTKFFLNKVLNIYIDNSTSLDDEEKINPDNFYVNFIYKSFYNFLLEQIQLNNNFEIINDDSFLIDIMDSHYKLLKSQSKIIPSLYGYTHYKKLCNDVIEFIKRNEEKLKIILQNDIIKLHYNHQNKLEINFVTKSIIDNSYYHFIISKSQQSDIVNYDRIFNTLTTFLCGYYEIQTTKTIFIDTSFNKSKSIYNQLFNKEICDYVLSNLSSLFIDGLNKPLTFFPKSSQKFTEKFFALVKDKINSDSTDNLIDFYLNLDLEKLKSNYYKEISLSLQEANNTFYFKSYIEGEISNSYFQLLHSEIDFFNNDDFIKTSLLFYIPYILIN
jgi:exodeoxyribonuclease V gamma subunit